MRPLSIRNDVRALMKSGKLPDVSSECEDLFKKKPVGSLDTKKIQGLWNQFAPIPFPRELADVQIKGISLHGMDIHTRKSVALAAEGRPTILTKTLLRNTARELEKVVHELNGKNKEYIEQLRDLAVSVAEELDKTRSA